MSPRYSIGPIKSPWLFPPRSHQRTVHDRTPSGPLPNVARLCSRPRRYSRHDYCTGFSRPNSGTIRSRQIGSRRDGRETFIWILKWLDLRLISPETNPSATETKSGARGNPRLQSELSRETRSLIAAQVRVRHVVCCRTTTRPASSDTSRPTSISVKSCQGSFLHQEPRSVGDQHDIGDATILYPRQYFRAPNKDHKKSVAFALNKTRYSTGWIDVRAASRANASPQQIDPLNLCLSWK